MIQENDQRASVGQDEASDRPTMVLSPEGNSAWTTVGHVDRVALAEDRLHWGSIWTGLLIALTAFVLLSLLGLAIGLTNINAGKVVATGTAPADAGRNSAIWLVAAAVISFLLGGYVAGRTAVVFSRSLAALHGMMIFFLALPLLIWLTTAVAGGNLSNLGVTVQDNLGLLQRASTGQAARDAAWWALCGLLAVLVAGTLGGAFGARTPRRFS
jgi:hypothetical protein